jgi:hypothetical protein
VNRLTCAWLLAALISLTARAPLSATDASTPPPPAPSATPDPITATGGSGQAVIGGAVRGGATYGTFPLHQLSGPRRCGRSWQLDSDDVARSIRGDARELVRRPGCGSADDLSQSREVFARAPGVPVSRPAK